MRWQQRVYPGVDFDKFIADVERLSGTNAVKHEMHEMRMALLQVQWGGCIGVLGRGTLVPPTHLC